MYTSPVCLNSELEYNDVPHNNVFTAFHVTVLVYDWKLLGGTSHNAYKEDSNFVSSMYNVKTILITL